MKALLMHRDRDFDLQQELPRSAPDLTRDLELDTLFRAMASGDEFLLDVARKALLSGLRNDVDAILYRQEIVKDCLKNPVVVRELYALAVEAIERRNRQWFGIFGNHPGSILHGSIEALELFVTFLRKLRSIAEEQAGRFESQGFRTLFTMLVKELSDEYFTNIQGHLKELRFYRGVLVSSELGEGNQGTNYILRKARDEKRSWLERLLAARPPGYTVRIAERDQAGARALSELRDRGLTLVANALAQSTDHILSFFVMLRTELAFYSGCLNLHDRLAAKGEPTCLPRPESADRRHRFSGLYDVCLSLTTEPRVVGNTLDLDGKIAVIITGPNQGGKSTFLRSIGLAQLMMQCGMFVAGESFGAELCAALFTHYKREEDATMRSGKLDEELGRMSDIADSLAPRSIVLFNESFAATNEREGSEIARQVMRALIEKGIKVFFVTHLYDFAHGFFEGTSEGATFLRAERKADGTRTFKLVEGEPLETSHGEDLYKAIFEPATVAEPATAATGGASEDDAGSGAGRAWGSDP